MRISPDSIVFWEHGVVKLNATIVITWGLMAGMTLGAWWVTRRLSTGIQISKWQNFLEMVVAAIRRQLEETGLRNPEKYLGFLGTLFLFIAVSALCTILPGYEPPTGSLSTTAALAIAVFVAVPFYGIAECGLRGYLKEYLEPNFVLLPIHIIGEFTRTLALAVRLFGNAMSGTMIVGILLSVAPFFFPVLIGTLDLLTGVVQAYIFSILTTVYIAAATRGPEHKPRTGG